MTTKSKLYFIDDLDLVANIKLGHGMFYGHENSLARLAEVQTNSFLNSFAQEILNTRLNATKPFTLVEIFLDDHKSAFEHLRRCVDVLTVLLHRENRVVHFGHFGVSGDLSSARLDVIHLDGAYVQLGFEHVGHRHGLEVSLEMVSDLVDSTQFRFLDSALTSVDPTESEDRALRGCQYFAMSLRELDDGLAMFLAMAAIEAWVLEENAGKNFNLARIVAWFSCLQPDDLCGRDRPACPYLLLNPYVDADRRRLNKLLKLNVEFEEFRDYRLSGGNSSSEFHGIGWVCSQWMRGNSWYASRSRTVHGRLTFDHKENESLERLNSLGRFWIATQTFDSILDWLEENPHNPAGKLTEAMNSLKKPSAWNQVLAAIDKSDFAVKLPHES